MLEGPPVLIEAQLEETDPRLQVVRGMVCSLYGTGHTLLPLASTLDELRQILVALKGMDQRPSIFVINTFGLGAMLPSLDLLMGETPALFLRRQLFWLREGGEDANLSNTNFTSVFKKMTPRLAAVWKYGAANSETVAQQAARRLNQYLASGQFRGIEYQPNEQLDLSSEHDAFNNVLSAN